MRWWGVTDPTLHDITNQVRSLEVDSSNCTTLCAPGSIQKRDFELRLLKFANFGQFWELQIAMRYKFLRDFD